MTQFLLLNCKDFILHQDTQSIQTQTQYCFCCLANNTQLISLIHCKHSSYLNLFDINQLEQSKRVVCYKCHSMLETIETFRQQVINAREKLTNQTIFGSAIYHKPQMLDIDVPPLSAIKKIKREVYGSDLSIQDPCCMLMNGNENNEDNLISVLPHVKDEPTDTERCSVKTDQGTETHTHGVTSHIIVKLEDVATQESLAHNVKVEIDQEPTSTTVRVNKGALRKERDRRYYDKHQERINQRRRDSRQHRQFSQTGESSQPTRQGSLSNKAEKKILRKERDRKYRERHRDEINKRRKERRQRQNAASTSEEISDDQFREGHSNIQRYFTEF